MTLDKHSFASEETLRREAAAAVAAGIFLRTPEVLAAQRALRDRIAALRSAKAPK